MITTPKLTQSFHNYDQEWSLMYLPTCEAGKFALPVFTSNTNDHQVYSVESNWRMIVSVLCNNTV